MDGLLTSLSWAGLGLFCVVSLVVGIRLLRLNRVTGLRPELIASVALLGIGPFGFAPALFSPQLVELSPDLGDATWAAAFVCLNLGTTAAYLFTQQVFRPGRPAVLAMVGGVGVIACAVRLMDGRRRHDCGIRVLAGVRPQRGRRRGHQPEPHHRRSRRKRPRIAPHRAVVPVLA
jgi:drug/metabolite transporter (DMT)-like permease